MLDGSKWSVSNPGRGRVPPGQTSQYQLHLRLRRNPRAGLDGLEQRNISCSNGDSHTGPSSHCTDWSSQVSYMWSGWPMQRRVENRHRYKTGSFTTDSGGQTDRCTEQRHSSLEVRDTLDLPWSPISISPFEIWWLVPTKHDKKMWLASWCPSLSCCCAHRTQLSQMRVLHVVRSPTVSECSYFKPRLLKLGTLSLCIGLKVFVIYRF